jgi:clan AA aspartic protease
MRLNRRLLHVRDGIPLKEGTMGEVRVKIGLTNAADLSKLREGLITKDRVRSVEVEAVVDTGAVRSVMPRALMERLGLGVATNRTVVYANGASEVVPVTEPVRIELEGRPTFEDCLVLGDTVLVGQTALESTDLLVDCVNGKLLPNPSHPQGVVLEVR